MWQQGAGQCGDAQLHALLVVADVAGLSDAHAGRVGVERNLVDGIVGTVGVFAVVVHLDVEVARVAVKEYAVFRRQVTVAVDLIPLSLVGSALGGDVASQEADDRHGSGAGVASEVLVVGDSAHGIARPGVIGVDTETHLRRGVGNRRIAAIPRLVGHVGNVGGEINLGTGTELGIELQAADGTGLLGGIDVEEGAVVLRVIGGLLAGTLMGDVVERPMLIPQSVHRLRVKGGVNLVTNATRGGDAGHVHRLEQGVVAVQGSEAEAVPHV